MKTLYKIVNYLNCGIWHNSNNSKKISNIFVIYKNFLGFFWPSINKVNKNSLEKIISRKGELQLKIDTLFQKQLVYNLIILNNTTCWNILLTLPLNKKKCLIFPWILVRTIVEGFVNWVQQQYLPITDHLKFYFYVKIKKVFLTEKWKGEQNEIWESRALNDTYKTSIWYSCLDKLI